MAVSLAPDHRPRVEEELTFDHDHGRLALGVFEVDLPQAASNVEVLDAYVGLVAQRRGHRPTAMVEVRTDDVDVLSELLDLEAVDIDRLIARILGAPLEEAVGLVDRLRTRRLVLGLAAAGVVAAGGIAFGIGRTSGSGPSPATTAPPTTASAPSTTQPPPPTTAPQPHPSITESPDGVGLVDPVEQDTSGVVLAPSATATPG